MTVYSYYNGSFLVFCKLVEDGGMREWEEVGTVIWQVKSHYFMMCMRDCRSRMRLQRSKFIAKVHFDKSQVTQVILGHLSGTIWEMHIFVWKCTWDKVDTGQGFILGMLFYFILFICFAQCLRLWKWIQITGQPEWPCLALKQGLTHLPNVNWCNAKRLFAVAL